MQRRIVLIAALTLLRGTHLEATSLSSYWVELTGPGVAVAVAGQGLSGLGSGTRDLTVSIGGGVWYAALFWSGSQAPCEPVGSGSCFSSSTPLPDQEMVFDGNAVAGATFFGGGAESQPTTAEGRVVHLGYHADVTSIVDAKGPGSHTFSFRDADLANNLTRLHGVSLLVVFLDPSDSTLYSVRIYHGLDFAFAQDPPPGESRIVSPVVYEHGAYPADRQGEIAVIAGGGLAVAGDRLDVSNNASVPSLLDSSSGTFADTDVLTFGVPAGVESTTVDLMSVPGSGDPSGCLPPFWLENEPLWIPTGLRPTDTAGDVFTGVSAFPKLSVETLASLLQPPPTQTGLAADARKLLRAGISALLNALHPGVNYPIDADQVIAEMNKALKSRKGARIRRVTRRLREANALGCDGEFADAFLLQAIAFRLPR